MMNHREETFLNLALKYKKMYEETPWWMFLRRWRLKDDWDSAVQLMIKCSDYYKNSI